MDMNTATPEIQSKKGLRREIYQKLEVALAGYQNRFKKKRFEESLKKASRVLANGMEKQKATDKTEGKKKNKDKKKKNNKKQPALLEATNGTLS